MTNTNAVQNIPAQSLAELAGISTKRLEQLANEGIIPPATGGNYPMVESLKKLFRHYRNRQKAGSKLEEEKLRLTKAQASQAEHDLSIAKRTTVQLDEILPKITRVMSAVRQHILSASNLEAEDKEKILRDLQALIDGTWNE